MSDKWLESEWIIAWRPLMGPQWEGGWGEGRGWWRRWKQLQLFQREISTPFSSPLHFFSRLYFSYPLSILLPPPPTMFLFSFTSLFPQYSPILIMDTWHSTCSVLCVVVPFVITGLNCKNPLMEQNSIWQLHGCKDIWLCLLDFYSHVHVFVLRCWVY